VLVVKNLLEATDAAWSFVAADFCCAQFSLIEKKYGVMLLAV